MNPLREHLDFFRQFRERFETTGAVAPSSRFLAQALTAPMLDRSGPLRVLEVGPGTGAVTRQIVARLKPEDRLDLVEINAEFARLLRERFVQDPDFQPAADRAQVFEASLEDFRPEAPYDIIISGLPFNNFPASLVEQLLDHCLNLLADDGHLSFFEYMFVRPLRRRISAAPVRRRLGEIEAVLQQRFRQHRVGTDWVLVNAPPAWVQHLEKRAGNNVDRARPTLV